MVAILISTRPQWCEKTINGLKITEIRKGTALFKAINKLIKEQGVAPMLIYCTKGKPTLKGLIAKSWYGLGGYFDYEKLNGKVVARFNATAEEIKWDYESPALSKYVTRDLDEWELCNKSCLTGKEMVEYLEKENKGTAIHIHDLRVFDKPREISEFEHQVLYENIYTNEKRYLREPLRKAPQSWCYVEV